MPRNFAYLSVALIDAHAQSATVRRNNGLLAVNLDWAQRLPGKPLSGVERILLNVQVVLGNLSLGFPSFE